MTTSAGIKFIGFSDLLGGNEELKLKGISRNYVDLLDSTLFFRQYCEWERPENHEVSKS